MKKLLFLLSLATLLLLATAGPAAANRIQWQVLLTGDPCQIVRLDYTTMWYSDMDENGDPFTALPADADDPRVGFAAGFVTRGNLQVAVKSLFQRMQVIDPKGKKIIDFGESTCHRYWSPMYRINDWTSPYGPMLPYNSRVQAGMWGDDWIVPLPKDPRTGKLVTGTYTVYFSDMLKHTLADPMWWSRVPGGEGYPPIYKAWGWPQEPFVYTFVVM